MSREWELRAACRNEEPDIWFSDRTRTKARAICAACPVSDDCLAAVLEREDGMAREAREGMFAGLSGAQRWELWAQAHPEERKRRDRSSPASATE